MSNTIAIKWFFDKTVTATKITIYETSNANEIVKIFMLLKLIYLYKTRRLL